MPAAARIKSSLAEAFGDRVTVGGRTHVVFPSSQQVLRIDGHAGLPAEKLARLKGVAEAALAGVLDVRRLRALPERDAITSLQQLRGVGPWTASHI